MNNAQDDTNNDETVTLSDLHCLITRPEAQGASLIRALRPYTTSISHIPLIRIQPAVLGHYDSEAHLSTTKLIYTSPNAVQHCPTEYFRSHANASFFAVGKKTADSLHHKLSGLSIPAAVEVPLNESSEGLLQLPALSQVAQDTITIVRGVGGRELLATQLRERGAKINYLEVYQREIIHNDPQMWYDQWKKIQINCIVVTSLEILEQIFSQAPQEIILNLQQCTWLVASERIAQSAEQYDVPYSQINICGGASDQHIVATIQQLTGR
ncbi:uroporphyrinogen-III synthase [Flocculibacter collagenilyticus]|uniref:uroporphyrinogen-III synthase n=1 Tax=Flocculibacter collagenilyticus TaxID=2744479 RepID=UPI0018F46AE4|nr:uroporphyrinogen-III synthase [Flocculibacter collagenilyticus]